MRVTIRQLRFFLILISLIGQVAVAVPIEGLETLTLQGKGRKGGGKLWYLQGGYVNPSWVSDYSTIQTIISSVNSSRNIWTAGANLAVGNKFSDRNSYFVRYDFTIGSSSFDFKIAHIDYNYLAAGKNTISLGYNIVFTIGSFSELYFSLGNHYRFTLNNWNRPSWSPFNYNTEDREWFIDILAGFKIFTGSGSFLTFDINNKDAFNTYNGDDLALDLTMNFPYGKSSLFRITSSSRFSGMLVGTADIGVQTVLIGLITPL